MAAIQQRSTSIPVKGLATGRLNGPSNSSLDSPSGRSVSVWSNLSRQSNNAVLVGLFTACKWFLSKRINSSPRALSAFEIFQLGLVLVSAIKPSKGTPSALATANAAVASGLLLGFGESLLCFIEKMSLIASGSYQLLV